MRVLGIRPAGARDGTLERVVEDLREAAAVRGDVAVVREDDHLEAPQESNTTVTVGPDGQWRAQGAGAGVQSVLDRLAPRTDVALVVAESVEVDPTIAIGRQAEGDLAFEGVDDLDVEAVLEQLEAAEPHETLESLVERVRRASGEERAGAIATFTGRVRVRDGPDDAPTELLEFERYEPVAGERMEGIRDDLEDREGVISVALYHRTGVVEAGEDIVHVVVLAGHRREAFRTVEDGIDRLKAEVPLFKREVTQSEEFWVHERQ